VAVTSTVTNCDACETENVAKKALDAGAELWVIVLSSHGPAASETWISPAVATRPTHKTRLALDTSAGLRVDGNSDRSNFKNVLLVPPVCKKGSAPKITSGYRLFE
jgi:hypothetical protein